MREEQTIDAIKRIAPQLLQKGVTGLSLFGSRMRGTARPDSDLDVIVDYAPESRFSLLDLVAIKRLIEEETGITADVMTRAGLHPLLKKQIENEAVRVY